MLRAWSHSRHRCRLTLDSQHTSSPGCSDILRNQIAGECLNTAVSLPSAQEDNLFVITQSHFKTTTQKHTNSLCEMP